MTDTPPPAASASLLVPVHLDAWVVDESNQEIVSWYLSDYGNLEQFQSPMPNAFDVTSDTPSVGVHLHWALPDALTHATQPHPGVGLEFPFVPNRWLVARFSTGTDGQRDVKLWVVESDALTAGDGPDGSPFLDPFAPTTMAAEPGQATDFHVQQRRLGASHTVEAWEAATDADGPMHLRAVGPGNVSFAAYAPAVQEVFAFVDADAPTTGHGARRYTYMVVGWYSDPPNADPLRGVAAYDSAHWAAEPDWAAATPADRFAAVMNAMRWSVAGDAGAEPPATSLYHGTVVGVEWPHPTLGNAGIDEDAVRVAIGNTGVDALAALVQAYARAQAGANPSPNNAWLTAGDTLAALIEAATYDALGEFGKPGGAALVDQRVRESWFGATAGGTAWDVVPATADGDTEPGSARRPGTDVFTQLAALNAGQQAFDSSERRLATKRQDLYGMWLRIGRANSFPFGQAPHTTVPWKDLKPFLENDVYPGLVEDVWDLVCSVEQMGDGLPDAEDAAAATRWADDNWKLSDAEGNATTLSALGLELKASAMPRFWHPTDPVVLVSGAGRARKHGEDGRLNADGTLTCRLPGAIVSGLRLAGGPDVPLDRLRLDPKPFDRYRRIPDVAALAAEAFLADPANASAIAAVGGVDAAAVTAAIEGLLDGSTERGEWLGAPPVPFALRAWDQAWAPLFLEWEARFHPTGAGKGQSRSFTPADWQFDGTDFGWRGTGFDAGYSIPYRGRTLLTPQAPLAFKAKVAEYLKGAPGIDTTELESLVAAIDDWDVLSQTLSGLTHQLATLLSEETFPPPPAERDALPCPRPATGPAPDPAVLIRDGYRHAPMLQGTGLDVNHFHPVRGGFLRFGRLQVVDAFGQTLQVSDPNSPAGFQPIVARALQPVDSNSALPAGVVQLPPRVVQAARLEVRFPDAGASAPVAGWLLPNHIDRAIAVYDAAGIALGEVRTADPPHSWRPRPGPDGASPAPRTPDAIADPALRAAVVSMTSQPRTVIDDLLTTIDETLWLIDPLGGRKDQFLSVLIGRPLAIVQATLQLSLCGDPAVNQLWDHFAEPNRSPPPAYRRRRETGGVGDIAFPVRLGELELREDGLLGYWLPAGAYSRFYAPHVSAGAVAADDSYIQPILSRGSDEVLRYQGDIALHCDGDPVQVTMLVDPRGPVHAYTGILPVTSAALPAHVVEDFMKRLAVTFDAGPVVANPTALRLPLPARRQAAWQWIEAAPGGWTEETVLDADDIARLSGARNELREGWLRFSGGEET